MRPSLERNPRFLPSRLLLFALAALLLVAAWRFGAFEAFSNPDKVRGLIDSWGTWAYVLFLVSFSLLMPAGVPAFVWVVPAGVLWPFAVAFPLSLLAIACGSSVGFYFARYIGRDWVAARLPPRIRRLEGRFSERGIVSVALFRLVFQVGAPTHWVLGLSRIGYGAFLAGTLIGILPVVALVTLFGHDVLHWVEMHGVLSVGILAAAVAAAAFVTRMLGSRRV